MTNIATSAAAADEWIEPTPAILPVPASPTAPNILTTVRNLRAELEQSRNLDAIVDIRDRTEALRQIVAVQGEAAETINAVAEVKLLAERQAGTLLAEMKLQGGDRKSKSNRAILKLSDIGIKADDSSRWQKVAAVPQDVFDAHVERTKGANKLLTTKGVLDLAKRLTAPKQTDVPSDRPSQLELAKRVVFKLDCSDWAALRQWMADFDRVAAPRWLEVISTTSDPASESPATNGATRRPLTFGSLFAGIGGFDLGFERAGMQCAWQVEIDDDCRKILDRHWPDVPKFGDIREFHPTLDQSVDVICGGFPCQDISVAGKGAGLEGERSGLWFEFIRTVRAIRPRYVVVENVPALRHRGASQVFGDLVEAGYRAEGRCLRSDRFGRPHKRERLFIVAVLDGFGLQQHRPNPSADEDDDAGRSPGDVRQPDERYRPILFGTGDSGAGADDAQIEPETGRVAPQFSGRMGEIKRIGNAVDPAVAEWIGRRIIDHAIRERAEPAAEAEAAGG